MKFKSLLASVAIFACASSANAADVIKHHVEKTAPVAPVIIAPIVPASPSSRWVGPYLGLEIGTAINKFYLPAPDASVFIKPKEQPFSGLFAGYNFAISPHAILGLDVNIDYQAVESPASQVESYIVNYKESALAAARLRLGFTQDRFMPYLAGGVSLAKAGFSIFSNLSNALANPTNKQKIYLGWNIGGGIDYALARNVFLRADYRFSEIKIKDIYALDANNNLHRSDTDNTAKSHELRIGAAYKF